MSDNKRTLGPPTISFKTVRPGDPIRARYLNKITSAVRTLYGVRRVTTDADFTQDPVAAAQDLEIDKFTITSEAADTVSDGATTIAKPADFRGFIRTRNVGGEDQVMLPAYTTGASAPVSATIMAAKIGEAKTGIAGVDWEDMNNNGRQWAEDT